MSEGQTYFENTLGKRKIDHMPILCNECPSCKKVSAKTMRKFKHMVRHLGAKFIASRNHHGSGAASLPSTSVTTTTGSAEFVCDASRYSSFPLISSHRVIAGLALPCFRSLVCLLAADNLFSLCLQEINLLGSRSIFIDREF